MKKFAAIFAAVALLVSLCVLPAAAQKLLVSDSYYVYRARFSNVPHTTASAISLFRIDFLDSNGVVIETISAPDSFLCYRNGVTGSYFDQPPVYVSYDNGTTWEGVYTNIQVSNLYCNFYSYNGSISSLGTATAVTDDPAVEQLASSIFTVGGSLVDFVVSNWVTLLAITSFVVVLCFGAFRRLVKGV